LQSEREKLKKDCDVAVTGLLYSSLQSARSSQSKVKIPTTIMLRGFFLYGDEVFLNLSIRSQARKWLRHVDDVLPA